MLILLLACDDASSPAADAAPLAPPNVLFPRTPAEKFAGGEHLSGAFSGYDAQRCDRAPLDAALASFTGGALGVPLAMVPNDQIVFATGGQLLTGEALNRRVVDALDRVYRLLALANDTDAAQHHVCVAPFSTTVDAGGVATSAGYIFYDTSSLGALLARSGGNFAAFDALAAHEFGHQLQFWLGDRYRGEVTVRRTELVADCLAGALLTMGSTDLRKVAPTYVGVATAVASWSDTEYRNPGHHGTAKERETAAWLGVSYALEDQARQGGLFNATGRELLTACEDAIGKHDQAQELQSPAYLFGVESPPTP